MHTAALSSRAFIRATTILLINSSSHVSWSAVSPCYYDRSPHPSTLGWGCPVSEEALQSLWNHFETRNHLYDGAGATSLVGAALPLMLTLLPLLVPPVVGWRCLAIN